VGVAMITLSTDGLSNSFPDEKDNKSFRKYMTSLLERIREHSHEDVTRSIPEWLNKRTVYGSADDVSLAFTVFSDGPEISSSVELPHYNSALLSKGEIVANVDNLARGGSSDETATSQDAATISKADGPFAVEEKSVAEQDVPET
jgi:hypothetical protein